MIHPSTFIKAKGGASQINVGKTWNDHTIEICTLVKTELLQTQWDGQNDQVFRLILTMSGRNYKICSDCIQISLRADVLQNLQDMSQMTEEEKQKLEAL